MITGASGGIGAATCKHFAKEGAIIVASDISEDGIEKVAKEISCLGGRAQAVVANVTNLSEVEKIVQDIVSRYGRLDILINNAGLTRDALIPKMIEEQWNQVIDVNLKGTFFYAKAAYGPMREQKYGKIVNTSSLSALGNIGQANYSAAKAGIIGLTKTLSLEYARHNINVNCVAPGFTRTPMTDVIPKKLKEIMLNDIPFRRAAEPLDIANAHLFLASDESAYITGQVIFVDGGRSVG